MKICLVINSYTICGTVEIERMAVNLVEYIDNYIIKPHKMALL